MQPERFIEPKHMFTVSMLPAEADARKYAATATDGVTFQKLTLVRAEEQGLNTGIGYLGRVIGITKVENEETLNRFNTTLKRIYDPYNYDPYK